MLRHEGVRSCWECESSTGKSRRSSGRVRTHDVVATAVDPSNMSNDCAQRVMWGFGIGGGLGASIGALYGTYGAFKLKVPGVFKIRFIGQQTVQTGLAFGVFLAAGSFLQCGR